MYLFILIGRNGENSLTQGSGCLVKLCVDSESAAESLTFFVSVNDFSSFTDLTGDICFMQMQLICCRL